MAYRSTERTEARLAETRNRITTAARELIAEGVRFERRVFHALFATKDRKEGMTAFIRRRRPR